MVTKHNINYKKYLKLNFYIMDLPIMCIMWLICDGYGSGSTKVKIILRISIFARK